MRTSIVVGILVAVLILQAIGYMEMKGDLMKSDKEVKDLYHKVNMLEQKVGIIEQEEILVGLI